MEPLDRVVDEETAEMLRVLESGFPAVWEMTGPEARAAIAARRQPVTNLTDVAGTEDLSVPGPAGDLTVRVYRPHGDPGRDAAAVVFYHGGGFVFCDLESHDGFCRALSRHTGALVVSVDYRLAPEHPAPAAAEDAHAAYCWVVEHAERLGVDPTRVAVAGDSVGGNLAAVTALLCRHHGSVPPAAQVLLYPVIDPAMDTPSYREFATGFYNTRAAMEWYWQQYLGAGVPTPEWLVAPARADSLAGLPPAVVVTAGLDPLNSEGRAYAEALRAAGVPTVHRDYPGLFHGFMTMLGFGPGGAARELLWADVRGLLEPAKELVR